MATNFLKAAGLYTHPNDLSSVPDSSTEICENAVIDRDGAFEQRRGFEKYLNAYTGEERTKQIINYKDILLRHRDQYLEFETTPVAAKATYRVDDNSSVTAGDTIELLGYTFTAVNTGTGANQIQFEKGVNADATAQNIASNINSHPILKLKVLAVNNGEIVTVTALDKGLAANFYSISSSNTSAISVSGSTFSGGVEAEFISSLETVLEPTSDARIKHEESNGNLYVTSSTGVKKISVTDASEITINSLRDAGMERAISISGEPVLLRNFRQFLPDAISIANDTITVKDHGYISGIGVYFVAINGGVFPTATPSISDTTVYYVEVIDNDTFKLHTSADLSSAINFTGVGSGQFELRLFSTQTGFLPVNSAVSYRYLIGEIDANNNLLQGWPSQTVTVSYSGASQTARDFNDLLRLTDINAASSGADTLSDVDYYSSLAVAENADPVELYDAIRDYTEKLDKDLGYAITTSIGAIQAARIYNGNLELSFNDYVNSYVSVGDEVYISGLSGTLEDANGKKTVSYASNTKSFLPSEVNTTNSTISLTGSSLINGTKIKFTNSVPANLPGGITDGTTYYVQNSTLNTFTLSTSSDGTGPVTITSVGSGTHQATLAVLSVSTDLSDTSTTTYGLSSVFVGTKISVVDAPAEPSGIEFTGAEYDAVRTWLENIVFALEAEPTAKIATPPVNSAWRIPNSSANVKLNIAIPEGMDINSQFIRVYRTEVFTATDASLFSELAPSEEFRLAYETYVDSDQYTAKELEYVDIASPSFVAQQAVLYTNQFSGEGETQANERPPIAADLTVFRSSMFYANTSQFYNKVLNLVGTTVLNDGDTLSIANGTTNDLDNVFTFKEAKRQGTSIVVKDSTITGTPKYIALYSALDKAKVVFYFQSSPISPPVVSGATAYEYVGSDGTVSKADRALQLAAAINKHPEYFNAFVLNNDVIVENVKIGLATSPEISSDVATATVDAGSSASEDRSLNQINLYKSEELSPSQQIDFTAKSLVEAISLSTKPNALYYAYYLSNSATSPGIMQIVERELNGAGQFRLILSKKSSDISAFSPNINGDFYVTPVWTSNPAVVTQTGHGLQTGDKIILSGNTSVTSNQVVVEVIRLSANSFSFEFTGTPSGSVYYKKYTLAEKGDNDAFPNRLYYSKFLEPESVPLTNYIDVGPKSKAIKRIVALRDGLFIFKEDAIYRLTGTYGNFQVSLFDSSAIITAPDSAAVLNNQIYVLTTQGVSTISDTGVSIISRPIEDKVIRIAQFPLFARSTFGFGYESARSYHLWTVESKEDEVATKCYRYNTFTQTWTEWNNAASCGSVDSADDRITIGSGVDNYIEKERKNFDRTDFSDRLIDSALSAQTATETVTVANIEEIDVGDVIMQEQYITISRWDRFLKKLDEDVGIPAPMSGTYLDNYSLNPGEDLGVKMSDLITELNSTLGLSVSTAIPTTSIEIRDRYNELMLSLNIDDLTPNSLFKDYEYITDSVMVEYPVLAEDKLNNTVTFSHVPRFVAGPLLVAKAIKVNVLYNPIHFGDPAVTKQVYQGTYMFEYLNFTNAIAGYSSDLSPGVEEIPFDGLGNGAFGLGEFGEGFYGGNLASIPFRTLVPRNKQLCRYIKIEFKHNVARESFKLFGVSLSTSTVADGYR